jgi:hypothetical protein
VALCLSKPAQLTFSLECTSGCDSPAYGAFPAGATVPLMFEPGVPETCNVKQPGRYTIEVQSNGPATGYALLVQTRATDALVQTIPADTPPPTDLDDVC